MNRILMCAVVAALGLATVRCSLSNEADEVGSLPSGAGHSYASTSNKGDYAEWTFSGHTLNATWQRIDSVGDVLTTIKLVASCGTYDSKYNYFTCQVSDQSTCLPGKIACNGVPSGTLQMMEVPGVAMFVRDETDADGQLHIGMLKDKNACTTDVSGDYLFAHTALGSKELVGVYRSDSDFHSIVHADFGFQAASGTVTPSVKYMTNDSGGALTLAGTDCTDGVRSRTAGGLSMRSMITQAGVFVLDLPAGMGGLIAIKKSAAATLSDFANRKFAGLTFPDQGDVLPLAMETGAVSGSTVPFTASDVAGNSMGSVEIRPLTNTQSLATNPPFPDFTAAPVNGDKPYSDNATLQTEYPSLASLPGFFRIDGAMGDTGRVIMVAGKFAGKVVAFGTVYNWRTTSDTNVSTGQPFDTDHLVGTGNFLLFEK